MTGDFQVQIMGTVEGENERDLQYKINDFVQSLYFHNNMKITGCTTGVKARPEMPAWPTAASMNTQRPPTDFVGKTEKPDIEPKES